MSVSKPAFYSIGLVLLLAAFFIGKNQSKRLSESDGISYTSSLVSERLTESSVSPKSATEVRLRDDSEVREVVNVAKALFQKKDIRSALEVLAKAPVQAEDDASFLSLRASCYVKMRDFGKATVDFEQALQRNPGSPGIRFNIAEMKFVTRRWEEARADFTELLSEKNGELGRSLRDLVAIKLLLCDHALGHREEFTTRAGELQAEPGSLLADVTRFAVVMAMRDGGEAEAANVLWQDVRNAHGDDANFDNMMDTFLEFGWLKGL